MSQPHLGMPPGSLVGPRKACGCYQACGVEHSTLIGPPTTYMPDRIRMPQPGLSTTEGSVVRRSIRVPLNGPVT